VPVAKTFSHAPMMKDESRFMKMPGPAETIWQG
jgi:hypothetical protein